MKNTIVWAILISTIIPVPLLFATWEPDVRLTYNDSLSRTSDNHARCIAAGASGLVHTVWWDKRDGNNEIYYKHSTNSGLTWDADVRLTNDPGYSMSPSIAENASDVHVVWLDYRDNADGEIYYKHSTDSGTTWSADMRLTNDTYRSEEPSLAVLASTLHLVYRDSRDGFPNGEIYYKRSTDNGSTWEPEVRLSFESGHDSQYPAIAVAGSTIHVIWDDWRDGSPNAPEIYYKRSTDNGTTWGSEIRLTNEVNNSFLPSLAVVDSVVHVVWSDGRWGHNDIYYKRSIDAGTTWSSDQRLTDSPYNEYRPSISAADASVQVVWYDTRNGLDTEIYYKRSTDGGVTWSNDIRLTDASVGSFYPHIAVADSIAHIVWTDHRDNNSGEIYYKRNPSSSSDRPLIAHNPALLYFDFNTLKLFGNAGEKYLVRHAPSKLDPHLLEIMKESNPDQLLPIIIRCTKQMNPDYLNQAAATMSKPDRRLLVISECKQLASETQNDIIHYLERMEKNNKVKVTTPLWVTNSIVCQAHPQVITELTERKDVWIIGYDDPLEIVQDSPDKNEAYMDPGFLSENRREICWGISKIKADSIWVQGYTGDGIVVGHMDSGVNYYHTDLADHMWDGSAYGFPHHGWDFAYGDNNPIDDNGHGSQTAGIVAGDGTSGSNTGVAPDAQIMALKIYPGNAGTMGQALQFALEYEVDLLSCSIGYKNPVSFMKDFFRDESNIVCAAGIVWCNAAGNGDNAGGHYAAPQDIWAPACCPGPWYAPNGGNGSVIAVGATDSLDNIASFSSYGPTYWITTNYTDYPYPPGLQKPDVTGPGVACKSLSYTSNNGYVTGINGTSFAQPHVAGAIALMLSKNPALTPLQIDSLLQTTAIDLGTAGRDSLYGMGRIDVLAAMNAMSQGTRWAQLWIINQSSATFPLEVSDITKAQNQSWLISTSPSEFTIPPADSHEVWVSVDTTAQGLTWGQNYYDTLLIWSNDLTTNPDRVPVVLVMAEVGIVEYEEFLTPEEIQGLSVSPNPFRKITEIQWQTTANKKSKENTVLTIYDIVGRCIRKFDNNVLLVNRAVWDATDNFGNRVPAGIYFCQVRNGNNVVVDKIVLVK